MFNRPAGTPPLFLLYTRWQYQDEYSLFFIESAMGSTVASTIGSAVVAGILLGFLGNWARQPLNRVFEKFINVF
jgi:hypothetical protein